MISWRNGESDGCKGLRIRFESGEMETKRDPSTAPDDSQSESSGCDDNIGKNPQTPG
jgi:hypothetical protein